MDASSPAEAVAEVAAAGAETARADGDVVEDESKAAEATNAGKDVIVLNSKQAASKCYKEWESGHRITKKNELGSKLNDDEKRARGEALIIYHAPRRNSSNSTRCQDIKKALGNCAAAQQATSRAVAGMASAVTTANNAVCAKIDTKTQEIKDEIKEVKEILQPAQGALARIAEQVLRKEVNACYTSAKKACENAQKAKPTAPVEGCSATVLTRYTKKLEVYTDKLNAARGAVSVFMKRYDSEEMAPLRTALAEYLEAAS